MRLWITSLLPALLLATWLPAHAQTQEPTRAKGSIAGKGATTKATPAGPSAKAAVEGKRPQFTAGSTPTAAAATAQSTRPESAPAAPASAKDSSRCHSSGSDA